MKPLDITAAKAEAHRFLNTVQEWEQKVAENQAAFVKARKEHPERDWPYAPDVPGVEHAAMRRASLDLTRALSRMRSRS